MGDFSMFGKSYNKVGNNDAHLCLYTAGDVSVKTANRFVSIFKNGKLAIDGITELFSVNSEEEMARNGIYLVNTTDKDGKAVQAVYLNLNGTKVLLSSQAGGYLSYNVLQDLTPENFLQAALNMGLYFKTLKDAKAKGLTEGLVYVLEDQKLYKVVNGDLVELKGSETKETGGSGNFKTLHVGKLFIDGESENLQADSRFAIHVSGTEYVIFQNNQVFVKRDVVFGRDITLKTEGAQQGHEGFLLYRQAEKVFLEVDKLIIHDADPEYTPNKYPVYIGTSAQNLITKASFNRAPHELSFSLKYKSEFQLNDYVLIQASDDNQLKVDGVFSTITVGGNQKDVFRIEAKLATPPSVELKAKVTFAYMEVSEDKEKTVDISITPTTVDTATGHVIPNTVGVSDYIENITAFYTILSVEIVSGDSNIYYDQVSDKSTPVSFIGKVMSLNPLIATFPTQSNSMDTFPLNLKNSPIYRVGNAANNIRILYHVGNTFSLMECTLVGGQLVMKPTTRVGDLSSVPMPKPLGSTDPDTYFIGHGIYTDNLCAITPSLFGTNFYGITGNEYPKYHTTLKVPDTGFDDAQYDKVIPNIAWIKKLIKKAIDDSKATPSP